VVEAALFSHHSSDGGAEGTNKYTSELSVSECS